MHAFVMDKSEDFVAIDGVSIRCLNLLCKMHYADVVVLHSALEKKITEKSHIKL